jgi:thiosulfate dehydrogenase
MTRGRNLSWVVLGIALSTSAHADGAAIAQKGAGSAAACQSCHGVVGEGVAAAGFPRLAGLGASYLERQLAAFAEGTRSNAVMMPIAKALSVADRKAVASHYASMPFLGTAAMPSSTSALPVASAPKVGVAATAASALAPAVGATLATRGRWSDSLPACEQCHGPGGRGVGADFPPLVGQSAAYLAAQLNAFKSKARPAGPMNLMGVVAQKLSDAEVREVADYYATLPAGGAR